MSPYWFNLIHFLYAVTMQGTRPAISLFADSLGVSSAIIGALVSVYALFPMLTAIQAGKWLDRYGARVMVALGGMGMVTALSIPMIFPHLASLFFSQILAGVSHMLVMVSLQKTIGNLPGDRDKRIASLSLVGSMGGMVGPLLCGYSYEYFGFQMTIVWATLLSVFALSVGMGLRRNAWTIASEEKQEKLSKPAQSETAWGLLRQTSLRNALLISGLVLYSKDLFGAYFPIYSSSLGVSPSKIGLLLSVMSAMAVLVRVSQFFLVRRFGRNPVLLWTLMVSGIAFLCVPLTSNLAILAILTMILGAGLGLGQPLSLVFAMNMSPPGRQGEVLGMRLTFNRGSQFFAPLFFGAIGGFGLAPIFYVSGFMLLIGSRLARSGSSVSAETDK